MPAAADRAQLAGLIEKTITFRLQERHADALDAIDTALALRPDYVALQVERGIVLTALKRHEEAVASFDRFLQVFPAQPEVAELRDACVRQAMAHFERALESPANPLPALLARADLHLRLNRHADAQADYMRVLAMAPDHGDALNNLGNALLALGRPAESLQTYERLLHAEPHNAAAWFNRGNVLQQLGRLDEALESYDHALSRAPGLAEAHLERAHCLLAAGDFEAGWKEYEWRWQTAQLKGRHLRTRAPGWTCDRHLAGKTILLWAEQGLGDTIQFARYIPRVAALGARVVLRVPAVLESLMKTLSPGIEIIGNGDPLPEHDLHCPLMSLPLALGHRQTGMPDGSGHGYLQADADRKEAWRRLLGTRTRPRIGIAWAGRRHGIINHTRDMPLRALHTLTDLEIELVSLQRDIPAEDQELLAAMPQLRRFGEVLTDFADTAALIANLDLVISVDTAVAHLAGALGKPCWILLRHSGEWRWQRERSDSPWYPSVRLFRQERPGDWEGVVWDVQQELKATAQ